MDESKFPPLYLGCPVEVSSDPSRSDRVFGQVIEAKPNSAVVYTISADSGLSIRYCWHVSDPRCQEHKEQFQDPSRGVFDLTVGEKERRRIMRRLDGLEGALAELTGRLMQIESAPKQGPPEPVTRRRGRPRKQSVLSG